MKIKVKDKIRLSTRGLFWVLCLYPMAWGYDWLQFCGDGRHSCINTQETTLNPENVKGLKKIFSIPLTNAMDAQPCFLSGVTTVDGIKDLLFVLTSQGEIIAMDAYTGKSVWTKKYGGANTYLVTGPAIDPSRKYIYTYGLDGMVHKLGVADGVEVTTGGWPELVTAVKSMRGYSMTIVSPKDGNTYLYVTVTFYGNSPGAVTIINLADGKQRVWNGVCSGYAGHFGMAGAPPCDDAGGNPWSRAGVVYHPELDRIFIPYGNDGGHGYNTTNLNWSSSIIALRPDGTSDNGMPLDNHTAVTDKGGCRNMAPGLIPTLPGCKVKYLGIVGGKDARLRFINLEDMSGQGGVGHLAPDLGKVVNVALGGNIYGHALIWTNPTDKSVWAYIGSEEGLSSMQIGVDGTGTPTMNFKWTHKSSFTTTPTIANGVLYLSDGGGQARFWAGDNHGVHKIYALNPVTGAELWSAPIDYHHWSSPIIANGVVYIADGKTGENGASQDNTGTITAFSLTADHPIHNLRSVEVTGLSYRIHSGHLILALPRVGPASLSILSLNGKIRLQRHFEGGKPLDLSLPVNLKGALLLQVSQGQGESTYRIHLD
jgi:hypothetical protein